MNRTLLVGAPSTTWREWLRDHRGVHDLICLDPGDPDHHHLARVVLFRDGVPVYRRFVGSLDARSAPHVVVAGLAQALIRSGERVIVETFGARPQPLVRQTLSLVAELLRPDRVLAPPEAVLPFPAERVELAAAFSASIQASQRKAQWLKTIEECEMHSVRLDEVRVEGARLFSGDLLAEAVRRRAGLEGAVHAEKQGSTLFVVTAEDLEEGTVGRALDVTHCTRATVVHPEDYEGLVCAFARGPALEEEFGFGFVRGVDWPSFTAQVASTAVGPVRVKGLRLGSLRVDGMGNELGEARRV